MVPFFHVDILIFTFPFRFIHHHFILILRVFLLHIYLLLLSSCFISLSSFSVKAAKVRNVITCDSLTHSDRIRRGRMIMQIMLRSLLKVNNCNFGISSHLVHNAQVFHRNERIIFDMPQVLMKSIFLGRKQKAFVRTVLIKPGKVYSCQEPVIVTPEKTRKLLNIPSLISKTNWILRSLLMSRDIHSGIWRPGKENFHLPTETYRL